MNEANEPKEYGKLTATQFKNLISKLPEIRRQQSELTDLVRSTPKGRLEEILSNDFAWASLYEMTLVEHLTLLMLALDKVDFLHYAARAPDPQQTFMDEFDAGDDEEWTGGWKGMFEKKHLVGLVFALQRTILSIMMYHRTLHDLVDAVRQSNDDDALFDAVRLDRSIVACEPVADRISKAELMHEKHFFIRLRNALKGPSQKHWQAYQDLRYALYVLRDLGFDKLSDDQLENLLVHQLKVYPNTYNARRNLRKQYTQSKKIKHLK